VRGMAGVLLSVFNPTERQVSQRGQALFDRYVRDDLGRPELGWLTMELHAFRLTISAEHARVPSSEIIEAVGPMIAALGLARLTTLSAPLTALP